MGYSLGQKSIAQLSTVDERLQRVIKRAIDITKLDFQVLEGVRTVKRQRELYAKGRTIQELQAKGITNVIAKPGEKKVTWTLNSKHFPPAEGAPGRAVDLGTYPYDPKHGEREYRIIRDAVMQAANEQRVRIRWGGDWDMDGKTEHGENDFGHFELA